MLFIKQLTRSFGANRAVDDISLTIEGGEIVGLAGENAPARRRSCASSPAS